jgi:glucose-6-phosphate 1-dehydrogenase
MSSQIIPVEPFDYVVFGGSGDLAERKLAAGAVSSPDRGPVHRADPHHRRLAQRADATKNTANSPTDALKEHLKKGEYDEAEVRNSVPACSTCRSTPARTGWDS